MGGAVLAGSNLAMATNLALPTLLNATIATAPTIGTCQRIYQHNQITANMTGLGMTPQISLQHNDGHIDHASPVHRLLPERQQTNGKLALMHNNQACTSMDTMEALLVPVGQGLQQTHCKPGNPMTAAMQSAMDHPPILVDPLHPPPPPDAKEGPGTLMLSPNTKLLTRMHHHPSFIHLTQMISTTPPPFTDKRPLEQQQDTCQCKCTIMARPSTRARCPHWKANG